ncbi:MAG: hypothetical protein KAH56_04280 [Candidatus Krumholzibacteria bacterium]|nr:hypothetical protein [Candidatus Krumholzibacteria bacterium]
MRRRLPLIRPLIALSSVFFLAVLAVFALMRVDHVVVARGAFAGGTLAVRAPLQGRIIHVAVTPGQWVEPGQELLRFEDGPLLAEIGLAEARVLNLGRRLDELGDEIGRLRSDIHPVEAEQAAHEVERSRLALDNAGVIQDRTRSLVENGLAPAEEYEKVDLALRMAKIELANKTTADLLLGRQQAETVAALQVEIAAAAAELNTERLEQEERRRLLALCTVAAPDSGIVVGPGLFEMDQTHVDEGSELLRIECGEAARFEGWLDDHGRANARQGRDVKIRLDGYPWLLYGTVRGKVEFVASRREKGPGEITGFPVVVSFDPESGPGPLLDGMTGEARIMVGHRVSLGKLLLERTMGVDSQ